jgi:hypothetical protein
MSSHGVRAPLIWSVLCGALVISCGSPPVYVVVPAPPPAAENAARAAPAPQQGGLAEAPEPAQAAPPPALAAPPAPAAIPAPEPQAVPAPVAPPVQALPPVAPPAQALPPARRGSAPPGAELVDLPGGKGISVTEWMGVMADKCGDHGATCLTIRRSYIKKKSCDDNDGLVQSQNPPLKKGAKVPVGSTVTLKIECPSSSDPGN